MLSLDQMRKLDPALADISDEELLKIRDALYGLAHIALDAWQDREETSIKSQSSAVNA